MSFIQKLENNIVFRGLLNVQNVILIITTINVMQVVEVILLMTGGGPYYATSSLLFMVYTQAFKNGNFGYAAAIGNFMFIVIAILSIIQFKFINTDVEY